MILDIETYSVDGAAEFIEEPSAPANYKDPDKIAAYIEQKRAENLSRCALDPDLCRIVCFGWSTESGTGVEYAPHENQERGLLEQLWRVIAKTPQIVGFNLLAFDLPVMIRRSQYLGVDTPGLNLDRYRTPHLDLMEFLSFNGKLKYRSLDFYCKRFGIAVPDATSGKDIDALVKAGDWTGVANHCRADVTKTRLLAERLGVVRMAQEVA